MDGTRDPAIVLRDLRKSYRQVVALDGLSLAVRPGSITGLLGPNGSGKTTTVSILSTALRPDGGQALVAGLDVTRTDDALERFGLAGAAGRLVCGYSGGMRRRLDVAAALMHRPAVLFLDEPTTGLDPESRTQLWRLVADLAADGTTVLLTTQYLEEADTLADRVVIIDRGRVVGEGPPHELRKRIGSAVVALEFADEHAAVRAQRNGPIVRLASEAGSSAVVGAARALTDADDPVAVQIREPSLDDVFLALTSSAARTQPGDAA
jgi:ABC-2 type transport system ATP-binding protein